MKNTKLYLPIVLLLSGASIYASQVTKEEVTVTAVEPAKELNWEKQDNKWVSTETDQVSTPLDMGKTLVTSVYIKDHITKKSLELQDIAIQKEAILKKEQDAKQEIELKKTEFTKRAAALETSLTGKGMTISDNQKEIQRLTQENKDIQAQIDIQVKELTERKTFLNSFNNGEIKKEEPKKSWWAWGSSKPANQTPTETAKPVEATPKADTKTTAKTEAPTVKATTPVAVLKKAASIKK